MNICIAILAWNEAESIAATIGSIARQTLVQEEGDRSDRIEVLCVANGCTDDTAQVAAAALRASFGDTISSRVCEVSRPSKANAWSQAVHVLSAPETDCFILMDADVIIHHPDSLRNMVKCLEDDADAQAVAATTLKHTQFAGRRSLLDRISLRVSRLRRARPATMAGCLYCARASSLRRIWLPAGLLGEDVLLRRLILTDVLRRSADLKRIVHARDATVVFESYQTIGSAFRTLKRRAMTAAVNAFLVESLGDDPERYSQVLIERSREDPDWFRRVIRSRLEQSGRWVMPKGVLLLRFRQLRFLPMRQRLLYLPIVMLDGVVHVVACIAANRALRRGQLAGAWADTRTKAFG